METLKKALWDKAVKETQRQVTRLRQANRKRYESLDAVVGLVAVLESVGARTLNVGEGVYDEKKKNPLFTSIQNGWSTWNLHVYIDVKGFTFEHEPKLIEVLEALLDAGCKDFKSEDVPSFGYRVFTSTHSSGIEVRVEATLQGDNPLCKRVKVKTEWISQDTYQFVCN